MERSQIFDLMSELKLYGMKAAFDEIMTTAVKRQHEPQRIVGDLLNAEISEKQARSIKYQLTIAKRIADLSGPVLPGSPADFGRLQSEPIQRSCNSNTCTRYLSELPVRCAPSEWPGLPGRPPHDRAALARAFVAKAVIGLPTTAMLIERLAVDKTLRRLCSWEHRGEVCSEATFSRAFAEFAHSALPSRIHEALIKRTGV
jgi:Transposase domain (DUF772)